MIGRWHISLFLGVLTCSTFACSSSDGESIETEVAEVPPAAGEPVSATTTIGPVSATVTLSPKSPLIGDMMTLSLSVDVKEGVALVMPESREAFSRLQVEDETHEREAIEGGQRYIQRYQVQAGSSGRLRIPPMRLTFVDSRPGQEESGVERELLTDELAIKVRPVLVGDEATSATLRPIRRPLEEDIGPSLWQRQWWAFVGGGLAFLALLALLLVKRARKVEQISPYERASVALGHMEASGLPDDEERDAWYVQLSAIVRRYLEDRFALRSPELTTEEFLRVAQSSALLSEDHKALLRGFLADCDQVKFAGYQPGEEESRSVLQAARRFLLETRELDALGEGPDAAEQAQPTPSEEEEAA